MIATNRSMAAAARTMVAVGVLLGAGLVWTGQAHAITDIDCQIGTKCKNTYHLPKLKTKEFRGRCFNGKAYKDVPDDQNCWTSTNKVTCTADMREPYTPREYLTCSCTNWDPTAGHKANVSVDCTTYGSH
ncbi:MAG: hypothetical protein GC201_01780 [Alphaproteobacteria bacterium]|nr:hypothetical protein [Alphaproteobacteria bacterium]